MMIDEQVTATLLAIIIIAGTLSISQSFLTERTSEPFSELAILGPNMKIADYPKELLAGERFSLYLYVGNHEGITTYYRVYVKVGNRSSVINENTTLNEAPMAQYDLVLQNNQTWIEHITLQFDKPGTNLRLVFELWTYNQEGKMFAYHKRWLQLWMNVTEPI